MAGNKKANCFKCGAEFEYEPIIWKDPGNIHNEGVEVFASAMRACAVCDAEIQTQKASDEEKEKQAKRIGVWADICPPIYQESDLDRLHPDLVRSVMGWNCENGLGFIGTTGAGKTRTLFVALRRAFDSERSCEATTHNAFSKLAQSAFASKEREPYLARLTRLQECKVLLIDDIGKPPPTERADAELEELIEVRTSHRRPILWSANGTSAWLEKRLGPDRGPSLVRRLSEFSTVVSV